MPADTQQTTMAMRSTARARSPVNLQARTAPAVRDVPVEETLGFLLNRANREVKRGLRRMLAAIGLTETQWLVLRVLNDKDGLSISAMSRRIEVQNAQLTGAIDGLERLGFCQRENHSRDRRVTRVLLTKQGRLAFYRGLKQRTETLRALNLSVEEYDELRALLKKVRFEGDKGL